MRLSVFVRNVNKSFFKKSGFLGPQRKLPSGRAMSAEYSGIRLVNVYAPLGKVRRTEKGDF